MGQGGSGSPHDSAVSSKWRNGNSGDTSTAFGATAIGGGGGGGSNSTINGAAGGSGGGSASGGTGGSSIGSAPNSSWTYYGNSGGSAASAGGGGAGASGGTSSSGTIGVTIFGLNIAGGGPGWAGIQISPTYGTGMSVSAAGNYGCPGGQSNCDGTANTGGGGGAGGSGGSGVVVIRYVNSFSVSISYSGTPLKTTKSAGAITITASTTSTGTVTFYANGRPINRCVSVPVSGTTATCLWRPMTHGQQYLTARYTSNDTFYNGSVTSSILNTNTGRRSTSR